MNSQKIIAISGSTREKSFNTALLRYAKRTAPMGMEIELVSIKDIPFFDQDLEKTGVPASVTEIKEKIRASDAVLIATPEYGNMVPGVLKNALEWFSRHGDEPTLVNKPLAIMGASDGDFGTARAQNQLLMLAAILKMRVNGGLRLWVPRAQDKIDENGDLTDEQTRERIAHFLKAFSDFIETGDIL